MIVAKWICGCLINGMILKQVNALPRRTPTQYNTLINVECQYWSLSQSIKFEFTESASVGLDSDCYVRTLTDKSLLIDVVRPDK